MIGGKNIRILFALIFLFEATISHSQHVEIIKADNLFQIVDQCNNSNKIHVYNFWATWCAPCIRELPQFESVNKSFSNVDVTLISIDDVDLLDKKVKPFLKKKELTSRVVLLDETDFNETITRIDKNWSGAIPATLIVDCRNGKRLFFEQEFRENELEKTIEKLITDHY